MVDLSDKDIRHIARLSALHLDDAEIPRVKKDLVDILNYVAQLDKVSVAGAEPLSHVHGAVNAFRDDVIQDSFAVDEAGKNSADFTRQGFRVPRIL